MLKYYAWALTEQTLSHVPFGKRAYSAVGVMVKRDSAGTESSFASSLPLARKAKEYLHPGAVAMEVGSGWFHHGALLLYLVSDDTTVYLFDVADKARLNYIHNYVRNLLAHVDLLERELGVDAHVIRAKLEPLLRLRSRDAVYDACGFIPSIPVDTDTPWLREQSVDFMVSNCVLNHIRPKVLAPELVALGRMLKPGGAMYHLLGHDDHWTFHDRKANMFNYYRYSDRYYRLIFETKLEYHNRMVKGEWLEFFDRVGLDVLDYQPYVTDESRRTIHDVPIDRRFRRWPIDDLAIIYSYVLLAPRPVEARERPAPAHVAAR